MPHFYYAAKHTYFNVIDALFEYTESRLCAKKALEHALLVGIRHIRFKAHAFVIHIIRKARRYAKSRISV